MTDNRFGDVSITPGDGAFAIASPANAMVDMRVVSVAIDALLSFVRTVSLGT